MIMKKIVVLVGILGLVQGGYVPLLYGMHRRNVQNLIGLFDVPSSSKLPSPSFPVVSRVPSPLPSTSPTISSVGTLDYTLGSRSSSPRSPFSSTRSLSSDSASSPSFVPSLSFHDLRQQWSDLAKGSEGGELSSPLFSPRARHTVLGGSDRRGIVDSSVVSPILLGEGKERAGIVGAESRARSNLLDQLGVIQGEGLARRGIAEAEKAEYVPFLGQFALGKMHIEEPAARVDIATHEGVGRENLLGPFRVGVDEDLARGTLVGLEDVERGKLLSQFRKETPPATLRDFYNRDLKTAEAIWKDAEASGLSRIQVEALYPRNVLYPPETFEEYEIVKKTPRWMHGY